MRRVVFYPFLLLLIAGLLPLWMPIVGGTHVVAASSVRVENVSCIMGNKTSVVQVTLKLPTPGYRINSSYSMNNNILIVNISLEPPQGLVPQVITYTTISFKIKNNIGVNEVVVFLNGEKAWKGKVACSPLLHDQGFQGGGSGGNGTVSQTQQIREWRTEGLPGGSSGVSSGGDRILLGLVVALVLGLSSIFIIISIIK